MENPGHTRIHRTPCTRFPHPTRMGDKKFEKEGASSMKRKNSCRLWGAGQKHRKPVHIAKRELHIGPRRASIHGKTECGNFTCGGVDQLCRFSEASVGRQLPRRSVALQPSPSAAICNAGRKQLPSNIVSGTQRPLCLAACTGSTDMSDHRAEAEFENKGSGCLNINKRIGGLQEPHAINMGGWLPFCEVRATAQGFPKSCAGRIVKFRPLVLQRSQRLMR